MNITGMIVTLPYTGYAQTFCSMGTDGQEWAAYTDKTTAQYLADNPNCVRVSNAEFDAMEKAFSETLKTVKEITEDWHRHLFECLPPADMGSHNGVSFFRVIEAQRGDLYTWCASFGGRYFELIENGRASPSLIAYKVRDYATNA